MQYHDNVNDRIVRIYDIVKEASFLLVRRELVIHVCRHFCTDVHNRKINRSFDPISHDISHYIRMLTEQL